MNYPNPSRNIDATQVTYHHDTYTFDGTTPTIPGATGWETQELERHWHNAVHAAMNTHRLAHEWLTALTNGIPHVDHLAGSGGYLPIDQGVRLAESLHALHHVANGIRHRLALTKP